ncbi:hypothetical protein ISN45_Aa04g030410 [Arabidopsis thaliana x Arabidopsis arenosa]|uniref:Uncharacterized protein n=1 Tax=Arabidopsis thaliana x Arabidopsis arenosa TaxID=1240361 RepID=A0A8T2AA97_9BRAS|nr:hypothetical protein ISN45_Aa04g030410 [Arabidopsis thaliana x Arabidopsis arenosa]
MSGVVDVASMLKDWWTSVRIMAEHAMMMLSLMYIKFSIQDVRQSCMCYASE